MRSRPGRRETPLVLCVDDDATVRTLTRLAIAAAGIDVVEAANCRDAIDVFERELPDLVLLDVHMDDGSGFDVCRAIRAMDHGRDVPVVMLTGDEGADMIRMAWEVGATDFEGKDVPPALLSQRVRFMLRAKAVLDDLHQSERRLAAAQRLARIGDWEWEHATGRHVWSPMLYELLDMDPVAGIVTHDRFLDAIVEEDRDRIRQLLSNVRDADPPVDDFRVLLNGSEVVLQLHAEVVRSTAGQVIGLAGTLQDITESRLAQNRIRHLAYYDAVTGLPNRRLFTERLDTALADARRRQSHVSVIFLDLDNFKTVNDTLGHAAGDELLKAVAGRLRATTRATDAVVRLKEAEDDVPVGRLGGDEFVVLLSDVRQDVDAGIVARRLIRTLKEPYSIAGREIFVTASAGISAYPKDAVTAEALLMHADAAMYAAKSAGRDAFRFFDAVLNEAAERRLAIEAGLRRALDKGELRLCFQPIVDAVTGAVRGGECLVRWQHPERGMVLPGEFIPVAEESGLITSITEWVINAACAQQQIWRAEGRVIPLSVNLSSRELQTRDYARHLDRIVDDFGGDPGDLTIEITEGVLLRDSGIVISNLERLKERGFRIALDDFGTGYSSLSYLRRFPVHQLKLDRSLVRDLESDKDTVALAEAVSLLSSRLGIETVAEGVETERQLEILAGLGFNRVQGFLFGKPLPAGPFRDLVGRLDRGPAVPQD